MGRRFGGALFCVGHHRRQTEVDGNVSSVPMFPVRSSRVRGILKLGGEAGEAVSGVSFDLTFVPDCEKNCMRIANVSVWAVVAFCATLTCVLVAGFLRYIMIGEVNRQLPDSEQIRYLFAYPGKMRRISREFRRRYPERKLDQIRLAITFLAMVFALIFVWQFGFFS